MDFNQVVVFVKVVQAGSFSAAARLLGLPTSTVSHRVAMLEKRLGVTLLQRTTRRLHLTDAGQIYFDHASAGLVHVLDAEAAVTEAREEPCGLLRITAPVDIGNQILSSILGQMRSQWPKVDVELVLMNRYVDLVAEGVDVAIRTGPLKDSTLIARQVGIARWALFASPDYLASAGVPEAPQALRQHACLQFTPLGKEAWVLHDGAANSVTVSLARQILINDVALIMTMVQAGGGVALLPSYLCRQACEEGRLVPVLPEWHGKADPIHIVYPRQRFMAPRLRAFVDLATLTLRQWLE
ncbi:LysR family transcriptional regulator [Aeromonas media]|uniref:LysR family transcriptional regulator n=1 Tax=Aeromonas media TaxID=651 RepID=UPI0011183B08|nr:LysR family transcriptional regulator [Aeromonas media]TNI69869.1 LysR family transcriptional regulator [Aeromonas media]